MKKIVIKELRDKIIHFGKKKNTKLNEKRLFWDGE